MPYTAATPIKGTALGDPAKIADWAIAAGAKRPDDVRSYLDWLYAFAPKVGINADVAVAQWLVETSDRETGEIPASSVPWVYGLNPSGIGVTDDSQWRVYDFVTGAQAAAVHLAHLGLYAGLKVPDDMAHLDPRWNAATAAGYTGTAPTLAGLTNTWAKDGRYAEKIADRMNQLEAAGLLPADVEAPPMALTFHRVPHPGYQNHLYVSERKIEGIGWDNLGQRKPKFIALHRMYGTLAGTLSYFTPPTSPHLTDYAIGVETIDGKAGAGVIHKYNDPLGFRSGWASGRVSAPYGDGKKIVDKYGINAVNRDGVSIELSGYWGTAVDDFAWSEYVKLIAYWIDYMEIPHDSLPLNPHTGINAMIWHQEFTIGTGKVCPGNWLMDRTGKLYKDVAAYLKPFQTGTAGGEEPKPTEPTVPKPTYAKPIPIAELAAVSDVDTNSQQAIVTREADDFIYVGDVVEAIQDTPRRQTASEKAQSVGPDLKKGEQFPVAYLIKAGDGQWWYVTDYWTRVLAKHTKRVSDVQIDAA